MTTNNPNSFYQLGGMEILSIQQDELSNLWKIYLSTNEHYLVSREFDRSVGLYANAPDDIVRRGLMDFSNSIIGREISMWKIIDMFIDRCFDDNAFDRYTENAIWLSFEQPSYDQIEDIISTYNCRIKWFDTSTDIGKFINDAMLRTVAGNDRQKMIKEMLQEFSDKKIMSIFMNHDNISEKLILDKGFEDIPLFMGEFSPNGDFVKFKYVKR